MGQPSPVWHPKIAAIHAYWNSHRPAPDRLPGRAALDPTDIPSLLPHIFMLDVLERPLRFRYRLVGSKLVMAGGRELTGRLMEEVHPNLLLTEPYADYPACVREHRVGWRRGGTVFDWGREHVLIERIVLPLAADSRSVDIILGLSVLFDSAGHEL
jgi:hypothetical protein